MHRQFPALACTVLAASLSMAAPAEARIFEGGITHAEMQKLLVDAGFNALTVESEAAEPDSVPDLVVMGGPARWYVQFMACTEARCADLHLYAGLSVDTPVARTVVDELNEAMLGRLGGNVYVDTEDDPILQADVNTDGVSGNNIRFSIRAFDTVMRCLAVKFNFDSTAGACDGLADKLVALANQGVAAEDVQHVVAALGPADLERILRENGYSPTANPPNSGLVSFNVIQDGTRWTAAVPEARADQINGSVFLMTGCASCSRESTRRANAYNAERRWLTASADNDIVMAYTTIPLSGGVTEASIGMMIRSFHGWAKSFSDDVPK